MVDHYLAPYQLDRDSEYGSKCALWLAQTQSEIAELVAATKETIASSRALIAKVDRILTPRRLTD